MSDIELQGGSLTAGYAQFGVIRGDRYMGSIRICGPVIKDIDVYSISTGKADAGSKSPTASANASA